MNRELLRRVRSEIERFGRSDLDWVGFATQVSKALNRLVVFDRCRWYTVDPGTLSFTGILARNMRRANSGSGDDEFPPEDLNHWSCPDHRTPTLSGGELRASCVIDGVCWGATAFLRGPERPRFGEDEVRALAALSEPIADGLRRTLLISSAMDATPSDGLPGIVVFDERGGVESISAAAERWIEDMVEMPPPKSPAESTMVTIIAARTRGGTALPARSRVRTRSGQWLSLYGTRLSDHGVAVVIQPAAPHELAPLIAHAYGLSGSERRIARLCLTGLSTKEIAEALHVSPYTVQDHLKSIFSKTGTRSRTELIGRVFLKHSASPFESLDAPIPARSFF
ncbi:helix-turn-helix domain-containing protein [Actinomadura rudentiformis]|uniref:Helix-turn-helix transcriptional regulator n=1 Tax=Actinomadura rudentiformis TaxID=359158 RepID=A0A6H9Z3T3_9ACTN|nr:helix-turn-helix transcriptional regulator [Actinomadura rudentiformis]KAB2348010.1 helix-turn-helix transcriptional regulator [Actinomadura rudentiformis]